MFWNDFAFGFMTGICISMGISIIALRRLKRDVSALKSTMGGALEESTNLATMQLEQIIAAHADLSRAIGRMEADETALRDVHDALIDLMSDPATESPSRAFVAQLVRQMEGKIPWIDMEKHGAATAH